MRTELREMNYCNMLQNSIFITDDAMNNGNLYDYPTFATVFKGNTAEGVFEPQKYGYLIKINDVKICRDIERINEGTLKLIPRNTNYPTETIPTANVTGIWYINKISF